MRRQADKNHTVHSVITSHAKDDGRMEVAAGRMRDHGREGKSALWARPRMSVRAGCGAEDDRGGACEEVLITWRT